MKKFLVYYLGLILFILAFNSCTEPEKKVKVWSIVVSNSGHQVSKEIFESEGYDMNRLRDTITFWNKRGGKKVALKTIYFNREDHIEITELKEDYSKALYD